MNDFTDSKLWELILTFMIGILSGFVSVTRRMLSKRVVSKLWIISEAAGVIFMTAIAIDLYPVAKPLLKTLHLSWVTQWIFVGLFAHAGSRMMYTIERKFTKRVKDGL